MIAIKIQCNCGQRYAFDVEPVGGSLPAPVACPICGADGTTSANEFISQRLAAPTVIANGAPSAMRISVAAPMAVAAPSAQRLSVAPPAAGVTSAPRMAVAAPAVSRIQAPEPTAPAPAPAPAPQGHAPRMPGQLDRDQAEKEARAKIMWGDAPAEVIKFLRMNSVPQDEAAALVQGLFLERAASIRSDGIKKTIVGGGLMCVPVVAFIAFQVAGYMPMKIFGLTLIVGAYGFWMVIKGTLMFLAPKSETGDAAEL